MYTLLLGANFLLFHHLLQNDGASVHDLDTVSVNGGLVGGLGAVGGVADKKAGESHQEATLNRRNEVTLVHSHYCSLYFAKQTAHIVIII